MAKTRYIKTSFWSDPYIESLEPIEKLLYLYLITNEYVEMCGVYEISIRKISFDTGISRDEVNKAMTKLQRDGKIMYHQEWIRVANFIKHQNSTSPKIKGAIERGNKSIPNDLIPYLYPIDTHRYPINTLTLTYRDNLDLTEPTLTLQECRQSDDGQEKGGEIIVEQNEQVVSPKPKKISYTTPQPPSKFEQFWELYPKKQKKLPTEKKYKDLIKNKTTTHDELMQGLTNYIAHIRKNKVEEKFIKQPTTWLNGGCRDDKYKIDIKKPTPSPQTQNRHHIDPQSSKAGDQKPAMQSLDPSVVKARMQELRAGVLSKSQPQ